MDEQELFFQCPFCHSRISMILDASAGAQSYIEDCEVCCRPIAIHYGVGDDGEITDFGAEAAD